MIFKKKFLLLTFFLIIIFQILLYTNNNQKTSFRFFKWTAQEVNMGKLISISFFSGLFLSSLLNTAVTSFKKNNFETIEEKNDPISVEEDNKSNIEMPPQRDVRDTQPTISVNYRVVQNKEKNYINKDQNYSNRDDYHDDWDNENKDW